MQAAVIKRTALALFWCGTHALAQPDNGVTVRQLTPDGGHLDWCHKSNVVAFDRRAPNGTGLFKLELTGACGG